MDTAMFLRDIDWDMPFRDALEDPASLQVERKLALVIIDENDDFAFLTLRMLYRDFQRMEEERRQGVPHRLRFNVFESEDIGDNALALAVLLVLRSYPIEWCVKKLIWAFELVRARAWLRQTALLREGELSPFRFRPDRIYSDARLSIDG